MRFGLYDNGAIEIRRLDLLLSGSFLCNFICIFEERQEEKLKTNNRDLSMVSQFQLLLCGMVCMIKTACQSIALQTVNSPNL